MIGIVINRNTSKVPESNFHKPSMINYDRIACQVSCHFDSYSRSFLLVLPLYNRVFFLAVAAGFGLCLGSLSGQFLAVATVAGCRIRPPEMGNQGGSLGANGFSVALF